MVTLHAVTKRAPPTTTTSANQALWIVLVHGLDSSSHTWRETMEQLDIGDHGCSCLAVDQRGCGYSPLGDPAEFSQAALVQDLHQAIINHCDPTGAARLVLVGHSLGGRIVLAYAARYPAQVVAVIVEDMDIAKRDPKANGIIQLNPYDGVFDRQRPTRQAIVQALVDVGYPQSFIDKALTTGRIVPPPSSSNTNGMWWSQVNPDFRKLCYPHVLSTDNGRIDCQTIANNGDTKHMKVHVLVSGKEGTVCSEQSIQDMKDILQDQLTLHRFPTAGHSIHSTASKKYLALVNDIVQEAKSFRESQY